MDLDASSASEILAIVPSVAVSVGYGSKTGVGAALGVSVARNHIGYDKNEVLSEYNSNDRPAALETGDRVQIVGDGLREGEVYEYLGTSAERYQHTAGDGQTELENGEQIRVNKAPGRAAAPGIYRYVGEEASLDGVTLDFVHDETDEDFDSIVRTASTGRWGDEGFSAGQQITITEAGTNNGTYTIHSIDESQSASDEEISILYLVQDLTGDASGVSGAEITGSTTFDLGLADYQDNSNWQSVDQLDLNAQDWGDRSVWKRVDLERSASEIQAYIRNSSIRADGALTADAVSTQEIDSVVIAASVAVGGGGKMGFVLSAAGSVGVNTIATDVRAFINGDGTDGIHANSVTLVADDSSGIDAIAGAASVAGSVGMNKGGALAMGLSLAFNRVDNQVEAISPVPTRVSSQRMAMSPSPPVPMQPRLSGWSLPITASASATWMMRQTTDQDNRMTPSTALDDANDPTDDAVDEALEDQAADAAILDKLRAALKAQGIELAVKETLSGDATYTSVYGEQSLFAGETVKLASDYANGGEPGRVHRYLGHHDYLSDASSGVSVTEGTVVKNLDDGAYYEFVGSAEEGALITDLSSIDFADEVLADGPQWTAHMTDLGATDYSDASRWELVEAELRLTRLVDGDGWNLVDGSGAAYVLRKDGDSSRSRVPPSTPWWLPPPSALASA